jgi:hypothetical protein
MVRSRRYFPFVIRMAIAVVLTLPVVIVLLVI